MERSEPALAPEWLRSSGSGSGGGSSVHHFASSATHSDVPSLVHHNRNRNSKSTSDFETPRLAFLDRTASSNSRRSSSNGSTKHAYSSFNRSHRDKDRERDKERLNYGDLWDHDSSDPLGNILRTEKDTLRRSQSMVSRKQNELLPRRVSVDSKNSSNGNQSNGNGSLSGVNTGSGIKKSVFEKDFPSLGSEERQGVPDVVGRVSSPGLSSAVQSLPVGNSALIGGEGWTSALAEVPPIIGSSSSSSSSGSFSAQQTGVATALSGPPSAMTGLNMAEALAQAPSRTRTAPQLSVKTQRLEELAIKQSRQLKPVTPSMPKSSVLSFSDKSKPKTAAVRTGEMNVAAKNGQQQPSALLHHASQSHHGGNVKSDAPKTSGKLLVLKPAWENGVSPSPKDVATPTSNASSRAANSQIAVAPSVPSAPLRNPNNPKLSSGERKAAALNPITGFTVERKPSLSQTQSRNDFFNLLKKKTLTNPSSVSECPDISSTSTLEISGKVTKEAVTAPASPHAIENGVKVNVNGDVHEEAKRFSDGGEKNTSHCVTVLPDEEEAAFLRSLGWEENYGEDEGLTEEEINAFYQEYKKRGMQLKLPEFHMNSCGGGGSSEVGSSDSESES